MCIKYWCIGACMIILSATGQSQPQVTWDTARGSVTVSGGSVTFTTYMAPTHEKVRALMTHINMLRVFLLTQNSPPSGIAASNVGTGGSVRLNVFAYDKTTRDKGIQLYGCKATDNGIHEDTWLVPYVTYTNSGDTLTNYVGSNRIKELSNQLQIYSNNTCSFDRREGRAINWAAAKVIRSTRPAAKIFVAGAPLNSIWDTTASALKNVRNPLKAIMERTPEDCREYYTPLQPVVIELIVSNATVDSLMIPGYYNDNLNTIKPYELFNVWNNTDYSNLFRSDRPTVIAHRAYWRNAGVAQNSETAVQAAADNLDVDAIEIDLRSSGDTVAICFHDDKPKKVMPDLEVVHPGASIYDLPVDTLLRYKLYDRFDWATTDSLLTLEKAFRYIRDNNITKPINLDIGIPDKVPRGGTTVGGIPFFNSVFRQAVGAACRYGLTDRIIFKGKYKYNDSIWLSVQDTLRKYHILTEGQDGLNTHPIIAYTPKLGDDIPDSLNYRNNWLDPGKGRGIPFIAVVGMEVRLKLDNGSPTNDFLKESITMVKNTRYNAATPLRVGIFSETPTSCQGYWTKSALESYVNFDDDNRNNFDWLLNHGFDYVITDIPEVLSAIISAREY